MEKEVKFHGIVGYSTNVDSFVKPMDLIVHIRVSGDHQKIMDIQSRFLSDLHNFIKGYRVDKQSTETVHLDKYELANQLRQEVLNQMRAFGYVF
jgi:hypothetical protein